MKYVYLFTVASLIIFSACKKSDYLDIKATDRPPLSAQVSFVNARTSNTGIQFWTFTQQITTSLLYPGQASPYLATTYGNVQINVTEGTGSSYTVSRQFGNSATYSASGGPNGPIATYYHTVFAAPSTNDITKDSLILFYDDLSDPPASQAKLRFVHLATQTGDLQVSLYDGTTPKSLSAKVSYGSAANGDINGSAYSLGPFTNVNAGTISIVVSPANNLKSLVIKNNNLTNIKLEAGKIYTVFLHRVAGEETVAADWIVEK
ncbi:DUF4397 domain-containing protein [Chitinophaga sp. Cy-1792]|uniref:DUF4397 domain-containing protein n=1 Tax=Chitinophaga sp. Cy-1792 TaxID=2608339 RepID=UPI001423780A|nr:DUF4397 domain-containing protein [Chitinophaga sp. Cy-1792]NIG56595.1 DUF4397 domain-containing protein [Chitinophaga sp. Cy-1792]